MVRQLRQKQMPTKKEGYPYPTRYGSHSSMVDEDKTEELSEDGAVVLKDEHGYYKTYANRIDTGLADPKRYGTSRLSWFKKNS